MCLQVEFVEVFVQSLSIGNMWLGEHLLLQRGCNMLRCQRQNLAIERCQGMEVHHSAIDRLMQ